MASLFDDSNEVVDIKINSAYATRYDNWRKKEELSKLKARYGNDAELEALGDESSSSEEEDEDAQELTDQLEKDFFKTLSCLKKKDPRIYDGNVRFFKEEYLPGESKEGKSKKGDKPMFLRDYERKVIVEQGGKFSEDEEEMGRAPSPTLVEEQEEIKKSFKAALQDDGENENDSAVGGLFEKRKKTPEELKKEDEDFREWLKGQQVQLKDKSTENELKYLHDFWNDPKLDANELFLKDYILNKKFLEPEDKKQDEAYDLKAHDSDDGFSEDEATVAKQLEFEHKYNFRFQEPDQEFLKRFPRTMDNSMRRADTRRSEKRKQLRERKEAEKESMKEDLKRLKALKRKEILEKIEKLKEVTGNPNFGFEADDLDGNFDPEKHDQRMSELFSQDYYGEEEDELPEFPDMDEELEIEKWDSWVGGENEGNENHGNYEPHCEDPDFNMDCEYKPTASFQKEIIESTKGRKRNRKSKLAQALANKKPVFDPSDRSFEQYVDEYYGLEFEDVIGDLPCRFKYRKVAPNSFGLTVEEILKADDKELNRWCSVKRAVQHRPDYVEKHDLHKYEMKSRNEDYKRKMLPSLYHTEQEPEQGGEDKSSKKKLKKQKKKKHLGLDKGNMTVKAIKTHNTQSGTQPLHQETKTDEVKPSMKASSLKQEGSKEKTSTLEVAAGKKSKKRKHDQGENAYTGNIEVGKKLKYDDDSFSTNENRSKKKKKKKRTSEPKSNLIKVVRFADSVSKDKPLSRRKKKNIKKASLNGVKNDSMNSQPKQEKVKKRKGRENHNKRLECGGEELSISDARLKAYGLKPKKFKNYLKYGKTDKT